MQCYWRQHEFSQESHATAAAGVVANTGILKAAAESSFSIGQGNSSGFSSASWSDLLTVNSAGHLGEVGHMTASIVHSWIGTIVRSGYGTMNVSANYNFRAFALTNAALSDSYDFRATMDANHDIETITTTNGPTTTGFDIIFGRAFTISSLLQAGSQGSGGGGGADWNGFMNASHSLYWGGIGSVSIQGNELAYDVISESGTDCRYSMAPAITPVPEPQTYLLILVGLGIISMAARLKNR